jgi:hypothetical protein
MSVMNAMTSGEGYSMSSPSSVLQPTMQTLNGVFARASQVAPAAISANMATFASWWNQITADFTKDGNGTTVSQVEAYIKAHPPVPQATIDAALQGLSGYLTTTCHITGKIF